MSKGVTTDHFGLAGSELKLTDSSEGKSTNLAEAINERGDFVARETFEALTNPSSTYTVSGDYGVAAVSLGALIDNDANPDFVITGFSINTAAGSAPTLTVSGESVPTASVEGYTYTTPTFSIDSQHKAQILFSAFTLTGTGCAVTSCSATAGCTLSRGLNEDGETASWDVSAAYIEVTCEILQSAATAPTFGASANWTITSPLTKTETGTDYEKYSATLRYTPTAVAPGA